MSTYRLTHLDNAALLSGLTTLVARDRATTAELLAHIAEVDARRLYAPAGYSSMFAYCLGELRLSEDATAKRIQAARAARRFPRLFDDLAAGRLHLTAICVLAPSLTAENVDELVGAAAGRSKDKLEGWLAERFGTAPVPSALRARVIAVRPAAPVQCEPVGELALTQVEQPRPDEHAPAHVEPPAPRYVAQIPIGEATHAKLRRAQALLAHTAAAGELADVLDRALDALIERLEKRKGAAPVRPRKLAAAVSPAPRAGAIPAHNQLEPEPASGRGLMARKRAETIASQRDPEVESALRGLGCRQEEARRAAAHAATLGAGTIEDRLRGALQSLGAARSTAQGRAVGGAP